MKMPILASKNNGIVNVIEENNLGIIIEPKASLILSSIRKLYKEQQNYITNIIKYAEKNRYLSINDYLEIIKK
jgi:hypothetical protein